MGWRQIRLTLAIVVAALPLAGCYYYGPRPYYGRPVYAAPPPPPPPPGYYRPAY